MTFTKYAVAVAAVLAVGALTACGPDESPNVAASGPQADATGSPRAAGGGDAADRDPCLIGTWNVDVDDMAKQVAARVGNGATGSGTGTLTLTFGDTMKIAYANTVNVDTTIGSGLKMTISDAFSGDASSSDWKAQNGKISGTMPASTVTTKITAKVGGKEQAVPPIPLNGTLDLAQGTIGYTCSGNSATLSASSVTWKLSKA